MASGKISSPNNSDLMATQVHTLSLRGSQELIAEYELSHLPGSVPKGVIASIRESGIHNMKIYRAKTELFMILNTDETYDSAAKLIADAVNKEVQSWEARMSKYQACSADDGPAEKWMKLAPIFDLTDH